MSSMTNVEKVFLKIGSIDRRWIFIIIALVVVVPLLVPIGLPIRATDTSKSVYEAVEALPIGSKVFLSIVDGEPSHFATGDSLSRVVSKSGGPHAFADLA